MDDYTNEKTMLRIYIGENDRYGDGPLSEALVDLFNREGYAEATVLRGIAGFGARSVHQDYAPSKRARRLPLIVEIISCMERIDEIMPRICGMMSRGMITLGKVTVAHYCTNISRQEKLNELKKMAH
jgi:PII-like signaling protein